MPPGRKVMGLPIMLHPALSFSMLSLIYYMENFTVELRPETLTRLSLRTG